MDCKEFKKLNWQEKENKRREAEEHIAGCKDCQLFQIEYKNIVNILRNEEKELNLYQKIKPIIEKERAEQTLEDKRIIVKPSYVNFRWALPIAASFILIFVLIFKFQIGSLNENKVNVEAKANIISMIDTPNGILVKWHDANKTEYTLIRSTDPKGLQNAVKIKVKGNSYLDKEAIHYPIVFYRVL